WLSGVFTCKRCGSPIVGGGGRRPGKQDPDATNFYRCRRGNGSEATCSPSCTIGQRWLESQVLDVVQQHVTKAIKSGALARALDTVLGEQPNERSPRTQLEARRRALEAERGTIVSKVAKRVLADEEAAAVLTGIRARLAGVKEEVNKLAEPPSKAERTAERDRALA